jgi:hypothetical protein
MLLLRLAARLTPGEMGYKIVAPLDALQKTGRADDGCGDVELGYKMAAPLDALQYTRGADDGHGDGKKLRADSPARIDYICILKSCKRGWEEKTDDGTMGFKGLGTTV